MFFPAPIARSVKIQMHMPVEPPPKCTRNPRTRDPTCERGTIYQEVRPEWRLNKPKLGPTHQETSQHIQENQSSCRNSNVLRIVHNDPSDGQILTGVQDRRAKMPVVGVIHLRIHIVPQETSGSGRSSAPRARSRFHTQCTVASRRMATLPTSTSAAESVISANQFEIAAFAGSTTLCMINNKQRGIRQISPPQCRTTRTLTWNLSMGMKSMASTTS